MNRIKIEFGYDGRGFSGLQAIPGKRTIQGILEETLSKFFNENIKITAAGRTDAGVSALCQVAHFDTNSTIIASNIPFAINKLLPKDIQIFSAKKVSENFNARFLAKEKTYKYLVYVSKHRNPVYENFMQWIDKELSLDKMLEASKFLIGKHDFKAFATKDDDKKDFIRVIKNIEIIENNGVFSIIITGNSFLYNMVRIVVGTLVDVGTGKISPQKVKEILNSKDRKNAGKLLKPEALTLVEVKY